MFLKTWRFITILLTALTMGLLFCHALEMPPKMQYDGALYVTIQKTLYQYFGPPVGAFLEIGALFTSLVLVFLVCKRGQAFFWTLTGWFCLAIALAGYFIFTEPVNVIIEQATAATVPADFARLRAQWEYSHAARFVLYLTGFAAFLISVLVESPMKVLATTRAKKEHLESGAANHPGLIAK